MEISHDTPVEIRLKIKFVLGTLMHGEIVGWIAWKPLTMWLSPPISPSFFTFGEISGLSLLLPTILPFRSIMVSQSQLLLSQPGFNGLRPDLPLHVYQRNLPHWRQSGATYFVTFRLGDALPQAKIQELKLWREQWEHSHPEPRDCGEWEEFAREFLMRTDQWLDEGSGECVFKDRGAARLMGKVLLHHDGIRCRVYAYVVMPNHCHVVVQPAREWELEKILGSWKGYSAKELNILLGRKGALWQEESYDRIIRDVKHLRRVVKYIGKNPGKAGIPEDRWATWVCPEWEECGWGFEDLG